MLLAIDLHKDFVDEEGVAVSLMISLKSTCGQSTKLDAPRANGLPGDDDAAFFQQIFDIPLAEIEAIVQLRN